MKNLLKKWWIFFTVIIIILSVFIYNYKIKAEENYDNEIEMGDVILKKIDTGNNSFSLNDNLTTDSEGNITFYTPGEDSSIDNRIVRSFDTITYYFDASIKGKNNDNFYSDRTITVTVELSDEESKFISFDANTLAKEKIHEFRFDKIDSDLTNEIKVTLYVLNAENKKEIAPKFTINESTNKDSGVVLGKVNNDTYYYEYINKKYVKNVSNVKDFVNYMPTYVSSVNKNLIIKNLGTLTESNKVSYSNKKGRYLSSVIALVLEGNNNDNYKGVSFTESDITFDLEFSQTGNSEILFDSNWVRNYNGENIDNINSIPSDFPYSKNTFKNTNNETRYAGNISSSNNKVTISDYKVTYLSPLTGANNNNLQANTNYIGTYIVSAFSSRNNSDEKNDIEVKFNYNNIKIGDSLYSLSDTGKNSYFTDNEYEFTTDFYDKEGVYALVNNHGSASVSKGSTITYKTNFRYKDSASKSGFKEYIKIDPRAFRVLSFSDKEDIKIDINCNNKICDNFTKDDLEVKFIEGDFIKENLIPDNYEIINSKLSKTETNTILESCKNIYNNFNDLNYNELMNLYGGPCIKEENIKEFLKINDAKTKENSEIPITKVIVQTKDNIIMPDDVNINITIKLRVRNVSDITKTYQVVSNVTSSDYDDSLIFFAPRVESMTNKNNYTNTVYHGQTIVYIDENKHGDSLKIVDFKVNSSLTVKNKNKDGSVKTNYNVIDNDTITYCASTTIEDLNEEVGASDSWFINNLQINIAIPDTLKYIEDKSLGLPNSVINENGNTYLTYNLPYTKANMTIKDVCFKTKLSNKISDTSAGESITVNTNTYAKNINGEIDTSLFSELTSSFTINATGIKSVVVSLENNGSGNIDKDSEFSYILNAYNNSGSDVNDYVIMNILPKTKDENGSDFEGNYKVKIAYDNISGSLSNAKFYCSEKDQLSLSNEVFNQNNEFKECNLSEDYVSATAIRITGIKINKDSNMDPIILYIKPEGNNYDNKYVNTFTGGSKTLLETKSNKITMKVINRKISGRVFYDVNEDGIRNEGDYPVKDLAVTLYSYKNNVLKKISEVTTNENGEYIFDKIDKGVYKIQIAYDKDKYDVTLRYATENTNLDSDGYKIEEGLAEISNKRSQEEKDGIILSNNITDVSDMDLGLIPRQAFGFEMKKYITQIDLSYNGNIDTKYYNDSKVLLSVRNSLNATAKVYYGISITNNSMKSGYVKLLQEDIPEGLIFDSDNEVNKDWFLVNGVVQSTALSEVIINPGETKYLRICLYMPRKEEANTFINTVSVLDMQEYEAPIKATEASFDAERYVVGEKVSYIGYNWHVINAVDGDNNEQILTLFMDNNQLKSQKLTSKDYKWSASEVNDYLNNGSFSSVSSLNLSILYDNLICDDQSGLVNKSYGGSLNTENNCTSNIYTNSKIRLLTENEFNNLMNLNTNDKSYIYGNYWLMNASDELPTFDSYGRQTNEDISKNAKYASNGEVLIKNASQIMDIRPVITISSKNIIVD